MDKRLILVFQETRLEMLTRRYNTVQQAQFYIEHLGEDFSEYLKEHDRYKYSFAEVCRHLENKGKLMPLERGFVSRFLFESSDLVYVLGRDGLVANTIKYLNEQPVIGINPDTERNEGILLPFHPNHPEKFYPESIQGKAEIRKATLASVRLRNGQSLYAVNDFFIGRKTHVSSRYEMRCNGKKEIQSSSGVIISTGMGSTGWLKSVLTGAHQISSAVNGSPSLKHQPSANMTWESEELVYSVREPFISAGTGASLIFGKISRSCPLQIASLMPEEGVIFSDGIENDYLEFNAGSVAEISPAKKKGHVAIPL